MTLDGDIKNAVKYALTIDDSLSGHDIDVQVSRGVVVLSGSVQTRDRKSTAEKLAGSFDGVREVKNEIQVRTTDDSVDEDVVAQIRAALDAQTVLRDDRVTVSVLNGTAVLTVSVRSFWERTIVEDIAMSANGVHDVQNRLDIEMAGGNVDQRGQGNSAKQ